MSNTSNPLILPANIFKADTYLIVLPTPLDLTAEYLAYAIALILKKKQKEVAFFIPMDYHKFTQQRIAKKLSTLNLSIASQLLTTNYTIAIDYQDGAVDSVSYDTKDGKFLLHVTPTAGKKFNFDSVSFSEGGGAFEQIIYCGSVEQTKLIRQQYPDLNKMKQHLVIDTLTDPLKSIIFNEQIFPKSMLKIVVELYKSITNDKKDNLTTQILSNLLASFLALKDLYMGETSISKDLTSAINMLTQDGASTTKALDMVTDLPSKNNVLVYQKIFQNLQIDKKNNVWWSIVTNDDVQESFLQSGNWLINYKTLTNLDEDIVLSWVIFLTKKKTYVVVRSNGSINLINLIESDYKGTAMKGLWTMSEISRESVLVKVKQTFAKEIPGLVNASTTVLKKLETKEQIFTK